MRMKIIGIYISIIIFYEIVRFYIKKIINYIVNKL